MSDPVVESLEMLVTKGWIPLRRMAYLLGKNHYQGIYARQRSKTRQIPTVRVGGINRVMEEDAIRVVKNDRDKVNTDIVMSLYQTIKKREERNAKGIRIA